MREASAAFNRAAMNGNVVGKVECYLADGTYVEFGPQDIMQGGIAVTSATSNSGSFGIGCAVIGRCTIRLRNDYRQLNGMALSHARVIPYVGALVGDEMEWLQLGKYWVEPFDIYDDIVSLSCLDALSKLELPCPALTGPLTLAEIVDALCEHCDVTCVGTFHNSDYTVRIMPKIIDKSCIEVLSYVAQVAGCYVAATYDGNIQLRWYTSPQSFGEDALDGGGFHVEADTADGGGFHFDVDDANGGGFMIPYAVTELKSLSASVAPHTVTGLAVSDSEGSQHVEGVDGYVLHIHDNPLVEPYRADDVAEVVAPYVLGMSLRAVRVQMPGSPVMEAGDPIHVIDRYGETYDFWATSLTWSTSGTLTASCDVESSSPLVRTYRRSTSTVDEAKVESIVDGVLDHDLSDLSGITSFREISTAIGEMGTSIGDISTVIGDSYDYSTSGSIDERLTTLENSTSVGQWIIQIDGVAQTTGTINFVT